MKRRDYGVDLASIGIQSVVAWSRDADDELSTRGVPDHVQLVKSQIEELQARSAIDAPHGGIP